MSERSRLRGARLDDLPQTHAKDLLVRNPGSKVTVEVTIGLQTPSPALRHSATRCGFVFRPPAETGASRDGVHEQPLAWPGDCRPIDGGLWTVASRGAGAQPQRGSKLAEPGEATGSRLAERSTEQCLEALDRARAWLVEATDLAQVKDLRDKAEALHEYAQAANFGRELANHLAAVRIRAERRAGEILGELLPRGRPERTSPSTVSLEQLGISKFQSTTWQRLAQMGRPLRARAQRDPRGRGADDERGLALRGAHRRDPRRGCPEIVVLLRRDLFVLEQALRREDRHPARRALVGIGRRALKELPRTNPLPDEATGETPPSRQRGPSPL
jgi:hypothetical protein